ncbi:hypothetical protein AYL99_10397 [Fonsecaea erecta]|uniref:Uncharacterized protein n=1 Tax=Fonsecaea erecta TaxID=1367422 RepID=A0A178Z6M5_9EURO|nr:hypothetical protein AYL99_10397 [Fonsecaea erecta]OAP55424.1 hypothetical protein AYL99_10397 [Fonsecaea erecta]
MPPVVLQFNAVPTQMGLKGNAIEGIVGISFISVVLVFFVILSFVPRIRMRRSGCGQGCLPGHRRVRLDLAEGTVNNNPQPPPPAYNSLYADTGRPQARSWSDLTRWWRRSAQPRTERDTANPPNVVDEWIGDPSQLSSSPPTLTPSDLPPYCGFDPHGLPTYETIACADEQERRRNQRSGVATRVLQRTRDDGSSSLSTRERWTGVVVIEREISLDEA